MVVCGSLRWFAVFQCSHITQYKNNQTFLEQRSMLEAPVAQWVKLWPINLAVPSSNPARGKIFSIINGVSLHTVFHYHPPIAMM